ncbi:hypothetical protein ACJX0J_028128, partial [Zea mays]
FVDVAIVGLGLMYTYKLMIIEEKQIQLQGILLYCGFLKYILFRAQDSCIHGPLSYNIFILFQDEGNNALLINLFSTTFFIKEKTPIGLPMDYYYIILHVLKGILSLLIVILPEVSGSYGMHTFFFVILFHHLFLLWLFLDAQFALFWVSMFDSECVRTLAFSDYVCTLITYAHICEVHLSDAHELVYYANLILCASLVKYASQF